MMERYLKESGLLVIGSISQKVITVILLAILSRLFGPVGIGQLTLSLVTITWFSKISGLGLETLLTTYVAKSKSEKRNFYPIFLKISKIILSLSFLASIIHFLSSDFLANVIYNDPSMSLYLKIASPLILLNKFYILIYYSFRGLRRFGKIVIMDNLKQLFYSLFTFGLIYYFNLGMEATLIAASIASIIVILPFQKILVDKLKTFRNFSKKFKENVLPFAFNNFLSRIIGAVSTNLDKFLIGVLLSSSDVGLYFSAFTFLSVMNIFSTGLSNTVMPGAAQIKSKKEKKYFLNNSMKYSLIIYLLASTSVALFPEIIPFVFGTKFEQAMPLAFPLFIMGVFKLTFNILNKYYLGIGKAEKRPLIFLIALGVDIISVYFLTNLFGVFGTALAQIAYFFALTSLFIISFKTKVQFKNYLLIIINVIILLVCREVYKNTFHNRIGASFLTLLCLIVTIYFLINKREKKYLIKKLEEILSKLNNFLIKFK